MKELLGIAFPGNYNISRVHGGDINESFLVRYSGQELFIKYNSTPFSADIFRAEQKGLETIDKAVPGSTPKIDKVIIENNQAMLIMEYIPPTRNRSNSQYQLGETVGKLHKHSAQTFGLDYDNFIGTLIQPKAANSDFISFYLSARLLPQIHLAIKNNLLSYSYIISMDKMENVLRNEIPAEPPCLIHGDLWGGNYLESEDSKFFLIDPAISYSHREMDISMSLLFGGYNETFYSAYQNIYPLVEGWRKRTSLFQLYFLLVHLNLFGLSYKGSVDNILDKWLG